VVRVVPDYDTVWSLSWARHGAAGARDKHRGETVLRTYHDMACGVGTAFPDVLYIQE